MKDQLLTYDDVYNIIMNNIDKSKLKDSLNETRILEFVSNTTTELIKRRNEKIKMADDLADRLMWGTD